MPDTFDDLLEELNEAEESEKKGSKKKSIFIRNFFEFEDTTFLSDLIYVLNKEQRFDGKLNKWVYSIVVNKNIESKDITIRDIYLDYYDKELRDKKYKDFMEKWKSFDNNVFHKV